MKRVDVTSPTRWGNQLNGNLKSGPTTHDAGFMGGCSVPVTCPPPPLLEHLMKSVIATGLTGAVAFLALLASPASAQQMFPAGGSGGTSCPSGSSYKGSGYCRANKPGQQFFPAGGSGGTSCPSGSDYAGAGYCKTR